MTAIARQGEVTTSVPSRGQIFAALAILLVANALAPQIFQDIMQRGLGASTLNLFGIGAVFPLAAYTLWVVADQDATDPWQRFDWLAIALVVAAAILPVHLAAKAATLPLALYLLWGSARTSPSFRIGFIILSLTSAFIWGAIILNLLAAPVLAIDAALVRFMTGATVTGNVVLIDPAASGVAFNKIVVMRGCSSLRNASQGIILWACLVQLLDAPVTRRIVLAGIATVVAMIAINVIRIAAIVRFPQHLNFLHDGLGATMFGLVGLIIGFAITGWAIVRQSHTASA